MVKFHQKVIILMLVFVLALASFGMIAAAQMTQSQVVAASISAPTQAQGATAFLFIPPGGGGIVVPNVSWNS